MPVPPLRPRDLDWHGVPRRDEYFGLRDKNDRGVLAWLRAENRHARSALAPTAGTRAAYRRAMKRRIPAEEESCPAREGPWWYLSRTPRGAEYPLLLRRRGAPDGPETTLLDLNELARDRDHVKLGSVAVSPDGGLMAWSLDESGDESFTVRVRDLATGRDLPDTIPGCSYGLAWSACGRHLFHARLDANGRSDEVRRHRLGDDPGRAALVHKETDAGMFTAPGKSEDGKFILIHACSQVTTEILAIPADRPEATPRPILPRRHGVEYRASHHGGHFHLLTNRDARSFSLLRLPDTLGGAEAETVVPADPSVTYEHLVAFDRALVLFAREGGLAHLALVDPSTGARRVARFEGEAFTLAPGENREFSSPACRLVYESPATPPTVIDLDLATLERHVRHVKPVPGHDAARYAVERAHALSPDGTRVPLDLLYRPDLRRPGGNPVYLHGYGSYGVVEEAEFHAERLALVDRGFVYALAHPRGGGELGRDWYEAGKLDRKTNTFLDVIACAEHLLASGVAAEGKICAFGRSAGGLLAGALVTMRPDLFGAVIAEVPFVDILSTMMDPSLPLTVREYDEWGNPNDPAVFGRIRAYAPYDNVREGVEYPPTLLLAGLNDPRVGFWEPAKMCARMRTLGRGGPFLLVTKMAEGHKHDAARYAPLADFAFKYAFAEWALNP